MAIDIKTPENRIKTKRKIQILMHKNLTMAADLYDNLSKVDLQRALKKIDKLKSVKLKIESRAIKLGYSKACREAIGFL